MPISSVVISCLPTKMPHVERLLGKSLQIDIHYRLENNTLIAVLETATVDEEVSLVKGIMESEGVLDVRLAYHNFEDLQELQP